MAELELYSNAPEPAEDVRLDVKRAAFLLMFFLTLLLIAAFGLIAEA